MATTHGIEQEGASAANEALIAGMRRDLRDWGIGLLVMGIVHFAFAGFLDPVWGSILVAIGVACLMVRKRVMYVVIGTALVIVGTMNIALTGFGGWTVLGVFQIGLGIHQVRKFRRHGHAHTLTS